MESLIQVEVVYATAQEQVLIQLKVAANTTLREAVNRSGICQRFPHLDSATVKIGVFSQIADGDKLAKAGDRIEIYRELLADPKTTRRQRAAKAKKR